MSGVLERLFGPAVRDAELDEWARRHADPRSKQGFALFRRVQENPDLTREELRGLWREANALVGHRAPADYGEFLAYGYIEGRRDALRDTDR